MRAVVDAEKCVSNGLCESLAPGVFLVDDDGLAGTLVDPVPDADRAAAEAAAKLCPTRAISIEGLS